MIVPGLELLKGWLFDAVAGVNAELPNVPRTAGVAAPPACGYYDELTHEWVAMDMIHRDALMDGNNPKPALILKHHVGEDGFSSAVLPETLQNDPTIAPYILHYAARKVQAAAAPADYQTLKRNAYETIRAAHRIIAKQFENTHSAHAKNRCEYQLAPSGLVINGQFLEVGDDAVYASLIIPLMVVDQWALGIDP